MQALAADGNVLAGRYSGLQATNTLGLVAALLVSAGAARWIAEDGRLAVHS
jgi:hypothetical protein